MKILFINGLIILILLLISSCNEKDNIKEIELFNNVQSKFLNNGSGSDSVLYVAISTMISPVETFNLYKDLIDYISAKLGVPIEFKQRKTYGEVNELLKEKKLDFAFICTGAYLDAKDKTPIELLVIPLVNGKSYYQAYVIVNSNTDIKKLEDLKDKSFAFTDPLSNTGYLYIINWLKSKNLNPRNFFSKTIFTNAHDYSIQAVRRHIVDGATVDGLVYEYLKNFQPEKLENIVVIHKSKYFGIPPFVVKKDLDENIKSKLREIMTHMHLDPEGKKILDKIMIDKFILGDESIYR